MRNLYFFIILSIILGCQNSIRQSDKIINDNGDSLLSKPIKDTLTQEIPSIQELKAFKKYSDSIGINKSLEFTDYYKSYCKIYDKYGNSKNLFISQYVKEYYTKLNFKSAPLERLLDFEKYVKDSIHSKENKALYYFKLIEQANYLGKITLALKYDSLINIEFAEFRTPSYDKEIQITQKVYNNIQHLGKINFPKDQLLWELGNNYCLLFAHVGSITEASQPDMTFPFKFYDSLISIYPKSEYADNAIFIELDYLVGGSQEGGDNSGNLKCAKKYEELLSKYPNTEKKAEIYDMLCSLYSNIDCSPSEKSKYIELSKKYGKKLINEFPNYKNIDKIKNILKEIDYK